MGVVDYPYTSMARIFHSLLMVLARATQAEMAPMVDYLKTENRTLRSKLPKRVNLTPAERDRLVTRGKPLERKIKELITIVSPRTFARWISSETKRVGKRTAKVGRPRKPEEVRQLVVQMAKDNGWGLGRMMGELKKLGLKICKGTVRNILLENGFDLGPKRGQGTWSEFIKIHSKTLWACDFFSTKVWTVGGLVEHFVLFFIHVDSRKVHVAGITANPDGPWTAQQARNMSMFFDEWPDKPQYIICDRDTKFTDGFCETLKAEGLEAVKLPPRSPDLNPHLERFVKSIEQEALERPVLFGESSLRNAVRAFLEHYHAERNHQSLGNKIIEPGSEVGQPAGEITCRQRLGGLLWYYYRDAA